MASEMQWTFRRNDHQDWREALDRAARTLAYVFANRVIFFEAIRAKFPDRLDPLVVPRHHKGPEDLYRRFQQRFQEAVEVTRDYEPIFYPTVQEWAAPHIFAGPGAAAAWGRLLTNIQEFNFRAIPYDIIGRIFQRLISPEERHKFGQHYTSEDIVDVINTFCIRKANTTVLDPACGSGSFLVRAYHRKAFLNPSKTHQEILREIFGSDIALFAAHLATLNLASRHIEDEENYPFIARRNFFEIEPKTTFCKIPGTRIGSGEPPTEVGIELPTDLGAIVGNPP
jgi:type I restriction-modification system DNA methylase subunit